MTETLHLSATLSLPRDAVTQKLAVLGRTGSGKSYCATKLCELMLDHDAQVIALDPVGVWYGLRVGGHYSIPILGGLHGDVPLEDGAGAFVADLIVDRGISAVLDVSQFESDARKARFAEAFAERFFFRKKSAPSPVHLFLEEAQEFVPQNPQKSENNMLHAFHRIAKLGRNFGIGVTLITQRPQEVNKKALNQSECLFAFQMTGPQERKAIESWVSEKGADEDIASVLPHLSVGECHVWSPQWLQRSETIKIAKKRSGDVSSTPKAGASQASRIKTALSAKELSALAAEMKETVERAKASDPAELKKRIAALEHQLADAQRNAEARDVPVLTDEHRELLRGQSDAVAAHIPHVKETVAQLTAAIPQLSQIANVLLTAAGSANGSALKESRPRAAVAPPRRSGLPDRPAAPVGDLTLNKTQQRVLDALAWWKSIGNDAPSSLQVGAVAVVDASGGYFSNLVGPLSSAGLITRGSGTLSLTAAGHELANEPARHTTLADYHSMLRERVRRARNASGKTVAILDVVIGRNGDEVTTEEIGAEVHIDHTGGYFSNTIGPLGSLGFITRPRPGVVAPTEILFPPGL